MSLTYWQAECLKRALIMEVRRMSSPSIPSLVKRGLMRRFGGRPGHIFYVITELGKQTIARHIADESANQGNRKGP